MTRLTKVAAALVPMAMFFTGSGAFAQAKVHIGVVTGTVSQSEAICAALRPSSSRTAP